MLFTSRLLLLLFFLICLACSDDDTSGIRPPGDPLIGTWVFESIALERDLPDIDCQPEEEVFPVEGWYQFLIVNVAVDAVADAEIVLSGTEFSLAAEVLGGFAHLFLRGLSGAVSGNYTSDESGGITFLVTTWTPERMLSPRDNPLVIGTYSVSESTLMLDLFIPEKCYDFDASPPRAYGYMETYRTVWRRR